MEHIPVICRLRSTANDTIIDLLNPLGFCIVDSGWIPGVTELKGGGVRIASQSQDDTRLVAGGYGSVVETFSIQLDNSYVATRLKELTDTLREAEAHAIKFWQRDAIYLEVQIKEDSDLRYSRIWTGSYKFGDNVFNERMGLPNNTLTLEREPYWNGAPPKEMIGPFANWCPNPSFEYWSTDGIVDTIPTGWYETLVSGSLPATWETRREDQQIAGNYYALDMNFDSAAGVGDWRLRTEMSWPGSPELATLRFWLFLTLTTATHTFSVRVLNVTGAVVATATFTESYTGYYYLSVDAPFLDDEVYTVELRWQFINSGSGGRAVIDHICFTPGEYDETTWPAENFYLTCSNLWNWEDDEMHYADKSAVPIPRHPLNFFDVEGVPGSAPGVLSLNIAHLGEKYGDDKNYPIIKYLMGSQLHEAGERAKDERHISMNGDGAGYSGTTEIDVSSESVILAPLETSYSAIYCWRADALTETALYTGRFKVFARMRWSPDTGETAATLQLEHWIGSQVGLLQQDEIILEASAQYRMINLTPRATVDWSIQADDPAALGLRLKGKGQIEGTLYLDFILLCPMDAGLTTISFDSTTPWLVGQAVSLDGNVGHQPVAITSPFFPWVRESSMLLVGEGLNSWLAMDAEAFTGSLYVAMYNPDVEYDYQRWIPIRWNSNELGNNYYPTDIVDNGFDTAAEVVAGHMLASGNDLRVFDGATEIDRWLQDMNDPTTQIWCNLNFTARAEGTITASILPTGTIPAITINEVTTGFPASGIFIIGTEAFEYTTKDNATKTFSGITRAIRGTALAAHIVGDTLWWVQHDLWIKYGDPGAGAPVVDNNYQPAFQLSSLNNSHIYQIFGEDDGLRTAQWDFTAILGSTFYGGNRGALANPWIEVGINSIGGTLGRTWVYNPCGISNANFTNGEKYLEDLVFGGTLLIQSSVDNIVWILEFTIPLPAVAMNWEPWNRNEVITGGSLYVGLRGGSGNIFAGGYLEAADCTLTIANPPTLTIGDEQGAATGKLLRFDHRGWAEILVSDDPIRALETWGAYLFYVADTTIGRYRVIDGKEDFIIGATSYYDLKAYSGFLWLTSDAGKIFYTDDTGSTTESYDSGSETWWCLEVYKRNLYAGADNGEIATYNPVDGWSILTDLGDDIRTLKTWNGKLYASVDGGGVYAYNGDVWTNVLAYAGKYGEMGRLEVYDNLLFVGTGNNGGDAFIVYTEDGVNWTEAAFPASSVAMAMEPFDGRLFIGFGFLFDAAEWASEWLLWHTRAEPKLYLTNHTGGPFAIYPEQVNRYYQMMEIVNKDTSPERDECYLERGVGPQTHVGLRFVPRWHALRDGDE